ncbi:hypothetical protein [Acaryochloris sp. CCMEE 5410]|uniref:hypothetical protein n=1 Tax=Acaryochloris sp. CCMEE 5410 TaxID=310037 RepID=UPI0003197A45|nr:hypothetical protein [Acaryochloris sp. CCMEE 5410]KAI9132030.1 hypothetical protein ON05_000480 [Acaryochloris sp. CCMEE 5410]
MDEYLNLVLQLLRNINEKTDITYLISTKDKHTAMVSVKEGEISYIRYGSLSGTNALNAVLGMEVESFVVRKHSLEHSKTHRVLPETSEILQKLCIKLPKSLEEYQASLKPRELNGTASLAPSPENIALEVNGHKESNQESNASPVTVAQSGLVTPVEPKYTEIPHSTIPTIKSALQQAVGPISGLIYDDAYAEISLLKDRRDLAIFIEILINEIDEEEYQKQFISVIKEQMNGIILVQN